MTASRGTEIFHPDEHRDPRLDKVAGFGRSIAQPPNQLPSVVHKGHKAAPTAILRTKNRVLLRKYAQQQINVIIRRGATPPRDLVEMASRPGRRSS